MFSKLKQFKDLREQGKKLQDALAGEVATETGAGGKLSITIDGNLQISAVNIDNELLAPDKKEKLQNGLKEAHNHAIKKMQQTIALKMKEMGGFDIPGLS